jgi:hypothetical protein
MMRRLSRLLLTLTASVAFTAPVLCLALAADAADGWSTPVGSGDALAAAQRLFGNKVDDSISDFVLQHEKVLRIPGTSKTRAVLPTGTRLSEPQAMTVRSQGKTFTLLLWTGERPEAPAGNGGGFGDEVAVLAVFPEGSLEASDVAEVKGDRETSFHKGPTLGDEDAFTVLNAHHNSSQGYLATDLFHLRDGRLRRIDSLFTLSANSGCEQPSFEETLRWRIEPDGVNPPRIVALRDLIHSPKSMQNEDCEHKPKTRVEHFQDSYRWDARQNRYQREGGNSGKLDKWNQQNM